MLFWKDEKVLSETPKRLANGIAVIL